MQNQCINPDSLDFFCKLKLTIDQTGGMQITMGDLNAKTLRLGDKSTNSMGSYSIQQLKTYETTTKGESKVYLALVPMDQLNFCANLTVANTQHVTRCPLQWNGRSHDPKSDAHQTTSIDRKNHQHGTKRNDGFNLCSVFKLVFLHFVALALAATCGRIGGKEFVFMWSKISN